MSGLFSPSTGGQGSTPRRLQAIELQRSAYGECIPLVYGTARVAPTLIWYDDFQAIKHSEDVGGKGGGGSEITSYTYKAALILALCEGPIGSVVGIWADKDFKTLLADYGFTLFTGAGGQAVWSHLTTDHVAEAIPYDHTAYVAATALELGSTAAMPNFSFQVRGLVRFGSGIEESLPSAVLSDYLTDAEHGAQFPYVGALTAWQTYCQAMGLFISPVEQTQRPAADFVRELMLITTSNVVWSGGLLTVVPYADAAVTGNGTTYTPDMTPEYPITDDDLIYEPGEEPILVVRKSQTERFNRVRVEYLDAAQGYNTAIAEAWDDADIALNGERPMQSISLHSITDTAVGRLVAQMILQRQLCIQNTYAFKLRADFSLLDPMDLLDLTDAGLGLDAQLVRIVSITDEENHTLTIEAEEVPLGVHNSPRYDWSALQGYNANYGTAPDAANDPLIFAAPPYLIGPAGGSEIWIALSGSGANWGGASVWASFDDVDYRLVGRIQGGARYGDVVSALPLVADPDTTSSPRINLNDNNQTITGTTTTNADELRNLAYIDGEIVSFRDATLLSAGTYTLQYFRRGVYGTDVGFHGPFTDFAMLDDNLFSMPFDPGLAGRTLYFKFTSFNIYGGAEESLADVSPTTFAIPSGFTGYAGDAVPLLANGTCSTAGYSAFKATGADAADSAVRSVDTYLNGCAVSFRASQANKGIWCGLESDPTAFTNHDTPEFGFLLSQAGSLLISENGVNTVIGTYTSSTTFSIAYDGALVRYLVDGALVRATPAANKNLYFYALMYTVGGQLDTIRFVQATGVHVLAGNMTNSSQWLVGGTGTQGNFENYYDGTNQDSSIVLGGGSYPLGPYGQAEPLWRAVGTGTGANGGWDNETDIFGADPTKPHRAVVWFRWNGTGTPTIAFGCSTSNTKNLAGTPNTDPYFFSGNPATLGITANKWYLAVGIIHGSSYGTTDLGIAGIYDPATGINIYNGTEFKFGTGPVQEHRAHQSGANNGSCVTYFAKPRFEEVTGAEPSLATLLSPQGALAYLDDVDTDHLAAEAASAVRSADGTSTITLPTPGGAAIGAGADLLSITLTTTGGAVSVEGTAKFSWTGDPTHGNLLYLIAYIDGADYGFAAWQRYIPPAEVADGVYHIFATDTTLAAGSHTFKIRGVWAEASLATGSNPDIDVTDRTMKVREYKR